MPRLETLQIPGGAAGKVLTSDASGNGAWQDASVGTPVAPNFARYSMSVPGWTSNAFIAAAFTLVEQSGDAAAFAITGATKSITVRDAGIYLISASGQSAALVTRFYTRLLAGGSAIDVKDSGKVTATAGVAPTTTHAIAIGLNAGAVLTFDFLNDVAAPAGGPFEITRLVQGQPGPVSNPPQSGAAFPSSPANYDEVYKGLNSSPWLTHHYRYNTSWGDAYKWECVGGPGWMVEVATFESKSTNPTIYGDMATVGPQITLDHAGVYYIEIGAYMRTNTAGTTAFMGLSGAGLTASDGETARADVTVVSNGSSPVLKIFKALTAGTLKAVYRASGGVPSFGTRWLKVTPVRLAP